MLLKRRAVRLALKELAKDAEHPDAVAQRLRDVRVTGRRGDTESCPIANYLRRKTGLKVEVEYMDTTNDWVTKLPVKNPYVVSRFIRSFDSGHYPDLES